mgnify:CR=1 FL=1
MPTTFTNNFKNILDKLNNIISTEFGNSMPTYIGNTEQEGKTQYMLINPQGSDSVDVSVNAELREYSFNLGMYFKNKNINETELDAEEDNEEYYIVNCTFTCQHLGNVS